MTTFWKNLKLNPPIEDTTITVKRQHEHWTEYFCADYTNADHNIIRCETDEREDIIDKDLYVNLLEIL